MNILDKLLVIISSLLLAAISIVMIVFSCGLIEAQFFWTRLAMLHGRWEVSVIAAIFLIISLKLIFSSLKTQKQPEILVNSCELGNTIMSENAIESLVLKISRDIKNIQDVKVKLKKQDDGISIMLKLMVDYDVNIPDLSDELRNTIKDYVENTAGVIVKDVNIKVDNVSNPSSKQAVTSKTRTLR